MENALASLSHATFSSLKWRKVGTRISVYFTLLNFMFPLHEKHKYFIVVSALIMLMGIWLQKKSGYG